jgi:hypothetical protein
MRRVFVVVVSLALVACSPNASSCKPCKSGLTFVLDRIAGSLSRGTSTNLVLCVDETCNDVTVSRDAATHSAFLEVGGLGGGGDHTITVKSKDGSTIDGAYRGKIEVVDNRPGGSKCPSLCKVGVVKVDDKGAPVPGVPGAASTTTVAGAAIGG